MLTDSEEKKIQKQNKSLTATLVTQFLTIWRLERRMRVREMGVKSCLVELAPFAAMVAVECLDVGLTTLSKAAMSKGMSHFVFVVYSNALASLILLPTAFFFTRFFTIS